MNPTKRTLAREAAGWFFLATMAVQLITLAGTGSLLLVPIARVSAEDMAALMTRAANDYVNTPLSERASLVAYWKWSERLIVSEKKLPGQKSLLPYNYYFLAEALSARTGQTVTIESVSVGDEMDYQVLLPTSRGNVVVQFSHERLGTQPSTTIFILILGSLLVSVVPPIWLARRLTQPLSTLAEGAERVGSGHTSVRLPETGPVEFTRLINAFNRMAVNLDQLVHQRTTMLAGISHDLRTPIARCRMALELLKTDCEPKLIADMERYLQDMSTLIASFMEYAKEIAADSGPLIALRDLVQDIAKGQTRLSISPGTYANVPAQAMRRVLENLISNAYHHGGGEVELALFKSGRLSVIEVRDQGPGIASEKIEAMFEPFVRGDAARTRPGSGLGLAIVRQICRANGWDVQLLSREGAGLTARLFISPRAG